MRRISWLLKITLSMIIIYSMLCVTYGVCAEDTSEQNPTQSIPQEALDISCESAVLLEAKTGKILYEKKKDEAKPPASVTKIMTLLLIMEAINQHQIQYTDMVTVSEHAASMGGSQVFLEPNEQQTVESLIKCIVISSANDACVAMAEYIAGSETAFVERMNEKAQELGMQQTHFANCCGLDVDNHLTSAYDIALMGRELTQKHPDIFNYTTIWMDTITHKTKKGESEFGLSNTNKLIKYYEGATGLKTGSTSKAKFCLCATASRNHVDLIAVVMASESSKKRVADASKLLDYGFAHCVIYRDNASLPKSTKVEVNKGKERYVNGKLKDSFVYILDSEDQKKQVTKKIVLEKKVNSPIKQDQKLGEIQYFLQNQKIGTLPIVAEKQVECCTYFDCVKQMLELYFWLKK